MTGRIVCYVALCVGLMPACSDNKNGQSSSEEFGTPEAACSERCDVALELGCSDVAGIPKSECQEGCLAVYEFYPDCELVMLDLANCDSLRDPSAFECSESTGETLIKEGLCTAEIDAVTACYAS